jgi:hypothetical protein
MMTSMEQHNLWVALLELGYISARVNPTPDDCASVARYYSSEDLVEGIEDELYHDKFDIAARNELFEREFFGTKQLKLPKRKTKK